MLEKPPTNRHFPLCCFLCNCTCTENGKVTKKNITPRDVGKQTTAWPMGFRQVRKTAKTTISFIMSVCPSVRTEPLCSHLTDFHYILYLFSQKTVHKIQVSLKSVKNTDQCTFISRSSIIRVRNVSDRSCSENQNTRFMFSEVYF